MRLDDSLGPHSSIYQQEVMWRRRHHLSGSLSCPHLRPADSPAASAWTNYLLARDRAFTLFVCSAVICSHCEPPPQPRISHTTQLNTGSGYHSNQNPDIFARFDQQKIHSFRLRREKSSKILFFHNLINCENAIERYTGSRGLLVQHDNQMINTMDNEKLHFSSWFEDNISEFTWSSKASRKRVVMNDGSTFQSHHSLQNTNKKKLLFSA